MTVGHINRRKRCIVSPISLIHTVYRLENEKRESCGTHLSAGLRRSRSVSKQASFDLLYNVEAAAHRIGVNLIRKG